MVFENYFLEACNCIKGKTQNAKRAIPLHPFTHKMLSEWIQENGRGEKDFIFEGGFVKADEFKSSCILLGKKLGYTEGELEEMNIRFYSGRHFFKTMMSAGGLGEDAEELFMGHSVSNDVKKRYNHKNKIGKENLEGKIGTMFEIIQNTLAF
jgi:integrase